MKKLRTLLALALTLCGTIAVFPVNAHAEETDPQTVTAGSEKKMVNPAYVRQEVIQLDEHDIRGNVRLYDYLIDAKGRVVFSTDSRFAQVRGSTIKIDRSILDYESYADGSNEIIVNCMVPAHKYYDEKELTLRFVVNKGDRFSKDEFCGEIIDDEDDNGAATVGTVKKLNEQKLDASSLKKMTKVDSYLFSSAYGVTIAPYPAYLPGMSKQDITMRTIDTDLSCRYNTTENLMRLKAPFLNTEARKISINCENTNVINLLGNNICDSIIGSSVSRIYVYPINEKGYEALAKGC